MVTIDAPAQARDIVRTVRHVWPTTPIVAVGVIESEAEVVGLAEAGAGTLVTAEEPSEAIVAAVQGAIDGSAPSHLRIVAILQKRIAELTAASPPSPNSTLTRRQREILEFVGEGMTAKEIAQRLVLSPRTVRNHIQNIYAALGVHRRSEAVAWLRRT